MRLQVRESYVAAAVIFAIILAYFARGSIFGGGGASPEADASAEELFTVRALRSEAQDWSETLTLRGQTAAVKKVQVRAEVEGAVIETPAEEGAAVAEGDVLCRLAVDAREAEVAQTKAVLAQRQLEYDAAVKLNKSGNRSDTAVAAAKANLDLAKAQLERAALALKNTSITAPFAGVFDTRQVEVGDFMQKGEACGALIQQTPFLIVAQVSERNVGKIAVGDPATAKLATGETVDGQVTFVSKIADEATRTFRVEVETPNSDGVLRDGVTAELSLQLGARPAHRISPAYFTLNDEGVPGVRIVTPESRVRFVPITILSDTPDGAWVAGLPRSAQIITVGQEFVRDGQQVRVADAAELNDQGAS